MSSARRISRPVAAGALLLVAGLVWWATTGIWTIQQNEHGVVLTFGGVSRVVPPGMHFTLPAPFEQVLRVPTGEVRQVTVGLASEEELLAEQFEADEPEWLTGDTNIVTLTMVVQYRIGEPEEYLFGVAERLDGRSRDLLVRQVVEGALTQLVSGMTIDEALGAGKPRIQREAKSAAQAQLDELGMGVTLLSANISEAAPPSQVLSAFNDVASASADRERMLSQADGYRRERIPQARAESRDIVNSAKGRAEKLVSEATGRAAAFRALAGEYQSDPELTRKRLLFEALRSVFDRVRVRVLGADADGNSVYRIGR